MFCVVVISWGLVVFVFGWFESGEGPVDDHELEEELVEEEEGDEDYGEDGDHFDGGGAFTHFFHVVIYCCVWAVVISECQSIISNWVLNLFGSSIENCQINIQIRHETQRNESHHNI